MRFGKQAFAALAATSLVACSGSDDSDTGTLSISLMDAPVDGITNLFVTISGIWIKPAGDGPAIPLELNNTEPDGTITVDLLELGYDNASVLVDSAEIEARGYNWIELQIEDAGIYDSYAMEEGGGMYDVDVDVPSGRIRLVSGFEVGPNEGMRVYFDWNVRAGLTNPVGREGYLLRPAFRVLYADEIGELTGSFTPDYLSTAGCPTPAALVVYVYEGGGVTPGDMGASLPEEVEPHVTVDAELNADGIYEFSTVVTPGTYTVAWVCDGTADLIGTDEPLEFFDIQTIEVLYGVPTTVVEFPPPDPV